MELHRREAACAKLLYTLLLRDQEEISHQVPNQGVSRSPDSTRQVLALASSRGAFPAWGWVGGDKQGSESALSAPQIRLGPRRILVTKILVVSSGLT